MKYILTNTMSYALECPVHFLGEQQTDMSLQPNLGQAKIMACITTQLYKGTVKGVAQLKNVLGTKSALQDQTWFGLGRRGA